MVVAARLGVHGLGQPQPPHGSRPGGPPWLVGGVKFKPMLEADTQGGHKASCCTHLLPPPPRHPFILSWCRVRERRKKKFEFLSKKLANNYLVEDGEFVASRLGWRVCYATLAGGAVDGCSCAQH